MKLPTQDKLMHFAVGMCLTLVVLLAVPPWWTLAFTTVVAGGKEVYDWFHRDRHTPDFWDFLWTMGGIFYVLVWWWLLQMELGQKVRPFLPSL